jgi:hypothetical protein
MKKKHARQEEEHPYIQRTQSSHCDASGVMVTPDPSRRNPGPFLAAQSGTFLTIEPEPPSQSRTFLGFSRSVAAVLAVIAAAAAAVAKLVPRQWYDDIDGYLQSIGFRQSAKDTNLDRQPEILLLLYTYDLLIASKGSEEKGHGNGSSSYCNRGTRCVI